ncbi:helix-turn-helix domain-containing protein [archaeon]|nr:helix-turn-helix domain-containing protein [archaeon]
MKLTFEIIHSELVSKFDSNVVGINNDCSMIITPLLYEKGMPIVEDCCYISETLPSRDCNSNKKSLFIICSKIDEDDLKGCGCSVLYFTEPQSILNVMNVTVKIFTKYSQWNQNLMESLRRSDPLEALLRLSLPIFENPLILIDSRFYVLAFVGLEPMLDFAKPNQKVDEIWIIHGKNDLVRTRKDDDKPYYRHIPKDYPRLFVNLSIEDYLLGNLSIQASHRELRACDSYLLSHLASVVQTAMLRSVIPVDERRDLTERMLSEVIMGRKVDIEAFDKVITSYGVVPGHKAQCLALKIPWPSEKEYVRNFLYHLGTVIPAMYVPTEGNIAAMIISTTRVEQQGIELISTLEEKIRSYGYRVGLSDSFENLLLANHYFAQAKYALECGLESKDEKFVYQFSDHSLDFILKHCVGDLKPFMLWQEGFTKLIEHDATGRAPYINTLRAYLDNNMNAQKAASVLHISRNSLLSQLERINALIEEDLKDPKVRFRYELSMLLYDKGKNEYK